MNIYTAWINGSKFSGPACGPEDFLLSKGFGDLKATMTGVLTTATGAIVGTIAKRYDG